MEEQRERKSVESGHEDSRFVIRMKRLILAGIWMI